MKFENVILFFLLTNICMGCVMTKDNREKDSKGEKAKIEVQAHNVNQDCVSHINAAIEDATKQGIDTVLLLKGTYIIRSPIKLSPHLVLVGENKHDVIIEQMTWGHPVFDVMDADQVTISNMTLVSQQPRVYPNGFVSRGTDGFVNNAGIYSNSSNGHFDHLYISGFTCGVFLSSWNGAGLYEQKVGNVISDIDVHTVDFGVLATGQRNLTINNFRGSYTQSHDSGASPHLIYISDSTDPGYVWSENINIKNCHAENSPLGIAFQIGSVNKGHVNNLTAIGCNGLLAIKKVTQMEFDSLMALQDNSPEAGSLFVQPEKVENVVFNYIRIESTNPRARLLRVDGKNNRFQNIHVISASDTLNDIGLITVEGEHNVLTDILIDSRRPGTGSLGVRLQGVGNEVEKLECTACFIGYSIMEDCVSCIVRTDETKVRYPDTSGRAAPNYNYSKTSQRIDIRKQ